MELEKKEMSGLQPIGLGKLYCLEGFIGGCSLEILCTSMGKKRGNVLQLVVSPSACKKLQTSPNTVNTTISVKKLHPTVYIQTPIKKVITPTPIEHTQKKTKPASLFF